MAESLLATSIFRPWIDTVSPSSFKGPSRLVTFPHLLPQMVLLIGKTRKRIVMSHCPRDSLFLRFFYLLTVLGQEEAQSLSSEQLSLVECDSESNRSVLSARGGQGTGETEMKAPVFSLLPAFILEKAVMAPSSISSQHPCFPQPKPRGIAHWAVSRHRSSRKVWSRSSQWACLLSL